MTRTLGSRSKPSPATARRRNVRFVPSSSPTSSSRRRSSRLWATRPGSTSCAGMTRRCASCSRITMARRFGTPAMASSSPFGDPSARSSAPSRSNGDWRSTGASTALRPASGSACSRRGGAPRGGLRPPRRRRRNANRCAGRGRRNPRQRLDHSHRAGPDRRTANRAAEGRARPTRAHRGVLAIATLTPGCERLASRLSDARNDEPRQRSDEPDRE
jgi:hypothetical protein